MKARRQPIRPEHIIESLEDQVIAVDRRYQYTWFNEAHAASMKALFGNVIRHGNSFLDLIPDRKQRLRLKRAIDRALEGERQSNTARLGGRKASPRDFNVTYHPILDSGRKVIGVSLFATRIKARRSPGKSTLDATDFSKHTKLEQEKLETEQRFKILSEAAFEGIALSENGVFIDCNDQLATMLGYLRPELIGMPVINVVAPESMKLVTDSIRHNRQERYEFFGVCKDGSRKLFEVRTRTTTIEGRQVRISVLHDITDQRRKDDALLRTQAALDLAPDAVHWVGPNAELVYVNDATCRSLGYSREELLSMTVFDIDPIFPKETWQAHWDRTRELGSSTIETLHVGKDGRAFPVEVSINFMRYGDQEYHCAYARDISERKKGEAERRASEDRLVKAQALAHVGNWEIDLRSRTIWGSDEALRIYGLDPTVHVLPLEIVQGAAEPEFRDHLDAALRDLIAESREYDVDFRIKRINDGAIRYVHSRAERILNDAGVPVKIRGVVQDITERKQAEEEVRTLNVQLDQRVRERTEELEAANRELESFSYSVSHDLRAPLRGIDGWSLALLEDCGQQLDEQARTYLDRVRMESQRMGKLIDDLLKLSRVSRAGIVREHVDLTALAKEIVTRLQDSSPDRRVEFVVAPDLGTTGDPALLEIALTNLLDNAWKFTAKHPTARIEFGQMAAEGNPFFVRDDGAGFDMRYAQKLFGVFQRMHRDSEFPGTGVGLATTQRIIHRHGGKIWVEAQIEHGATFYFTL